MNIGFTHREVGEECGFDWCNTDHTKETSTHMGHHKELCWAFLPSGSCDCEHEIPMYVKKES